MILLAVRTDKPIAELYILQNGKVASSIQWMAHKELSATIHKQIAQVLHTVSLDFYDLDGIIFYTTGKSFTGLRIGASVCNALAASLSIPVAAASGDSWLHDGMRTLKSGSVKTGAYIEPCYSSPAFTTSAKSA